jgi:L-lysine exporter family protein LysE/ArgO
MSAFALPSLTLPALFSPAFTAGMVLSISLIMAIGPQNAHVLRMGLQRQHLWLTVAVCVVADIVLIGLGVLGLAQLGGLSDKLHGALVGAGMLFLAVYGWQAFQRFLRPTALVIVADETPSVSAPPVTRRQALLSALAFSWLNPHAWLDTAVVIGTASLAYGQGSTVFGDGGRGGRGGGDRDGRGDNGRGGRGSD